MVTVALFLAADFYDCGALTFNIEWVKPIWDRVAYAEQRILKPLAPFWEKGFKKWGQRDFRKGVWKQGWKKEWAQRYMTTYKRQ